MKIYIQTLGCKVNQYETQALETLFAQRGHEISPTEQDCDAVIINTCAVTAESGRKSRQAVRHLRAANPHAVVGVCGCFSQIEPEQTAALGADVVFGSGDRRQFVSAIEAEFTKRSPVMQVDHALSRRNFEELPAGNLAGRTRAMLKIQDGCSNFCTYCIIPYARGPVRSLPAEKAAQEAEALFRAGYKEIVITGIEIASYGKDLKDGSTLTDAVKAIHEKAPGVRLRLGSLEPRIVTEAFCRSLSAIPELCPHFHLSLQSGCDRTLQRMRRRYTTARFLESVALLKQFFPGCGLTADLIVGFPGETEEDHLETLAFIEKCGFSSMHIFPYSPRPGTPAAGMDGQIARSEKKRRSDSALAVMERMRNRYLQSCIGAVLPVLFEQEKDGVSFGHAGNYCLVQTQAAGLHNEVRSVQITGVQEDTLTGTLV